MKKLSLVFLISFVTYPFAAKARPYATARTWADILVMIFFAAVLYQLLYIIFLRKKNNVSLGRSIGRWFLYFFWTGTAFVIYCYLDMFINGYTYCFLTTSNGPYYGFEAWSRCIENFIMVPFLILSVIYTVAYFAVSRRIRYRQSSFSVM